MDNFQDLIMELNDIKAKLKKYKTTNKGAI